MLDTCDTDSDVSLCNHASTEMGKHGLVRIALQYTKMLSVNLTSVVVHWKKVVIQNL